MIYKCFAECGVAYMTAPIKALVSEKFFSLCRTFGAENVGMMTGDGAVNQDAPIIVCTAEILSNLSLREGENARVNAFTLAFSPSLRLRLERISAVQTMMGAS